MLTIVTTSLKKRTVAGLGLLVLIATPLMIEPGLTSTSWAETLNLQQAENLLEGEITSIGSQTVDVAGKLYGLHPKLMIVSDTGQPMELKQLRPGLVIQYHVNEGQLDRIIVIIPR